MPHVDKIPAVAGQRGHLVLQMDGTIVSSSGELSNDVNVSEGIINLLKDAVPLYVNNHPNSEVDPNKSQNESFTSNGGGDGNAFKWSRLTVSFPEYSFVACLSNRKIHVVKRSNEPDE